MLGISVGGVPRGYQIYPPFFGLGLGGAVMLGISVGGGTKGLSSPGADGISGPAGVISS